MVVGKRLAERWNLPSTIRDCIWLHGQSPNALPPNLKNPRLVNIVTLADTLVREQHLGYSGNHAFMMARPALSEAIGISNEQIEQAMQKLVGAIEPRAAALGLGQASTAELYQQALSQANKELGRATEQLAAKNRKLSIRAKFFDALSGFQSELRPDAPPQTVLHAIGQTAVAVLNVTSAAVFSLSPGRDYAETVLVDGQGEIFETSLIDYIPPQESKLATASAGAAQNPSMTSSAILAKTPGDGPVLTVGAELEWFTTAVSPRLAHDHRFWICLEADGRCIGGVLWGAPVGESQRLSTQVQELSALASGWSLALRTTQIREEARTLSEQLAEANRQLQAAQSQILRTRTLITVGEMAAGAAHEMNNPLAVISGRSQLLASELSDPRHKAAAHLVYEQAQRLSNIITELMDFAKPVPPQPTECDPAELVNKALHETKMACDPVDRTIEVTMGEVPMVQVDPSQVTAALGEVIGNAIQATDDRKGQIDIHGAFDPYSNRVVITIVDNGCGMDEATLKRAFDPFFSSRPAGRRRGMGLAKSLRWIESSGGSIKMDSRPGQGTQTIVLLPAVKQEAQVAQEMKKLKASSA
jgi:signal transduction histidine kinase